jgi:hypothetical protein
MSRIWRIFFPKLAKLVKFSIQNKRIPKNSQLALSILSKCQQFFLGKKTAGLDFIFIF